MTHYRDGALVVLDHEVRRLQDELAELERRPERVEPLREILRAVQRLRHASDPDEPRPVRILRNAVEKVTLHLGRGRLAVSSDVLDFYVDTVDLLEDAVRRWPGGADFDPQRYAQRVREILDASGPTRDETPVAHGSAMAEEPVGEAVAGAIELTEPEGGPALSVEAAARGFGDDGEPAVVSAAGAVEVEAYAEGTVDLPDEAGTRLDDEASTRARPEEDAAVEVLSAEDVPPDVRARFTQADLRDLLATTWTSAARAEAGAVEAEPSEADAWTGVARADAPALERADERAGGLAASFSTFESLRDTRAEPGLAAPAAHRGQAAEAIARLRDVLDAFSLSLQDLERTSDRLLDEVGAGIGGETLTVLAGRLDAEKSKVLEVFDRAIESFRRRSG